MRFGVIEMKGLTVAFAGSRQTNVELILEPRNQSHAAPIPTDPSVFDFQFDVRTRLVPPVLPFGRCQLGDAHTSHFQFQRRPGSKCGLRRTNEQLKRERWHVRWGRLLSRGWKTG